MHSFPVGQTKELPRGRGPGYAARASPLAQLGAAQGHGRLARAAARALLLLLRLRRRSQPRRAAHHQPCAREQGASAAPGCCWEPRAPRRASRRVMMGRHRTVRRGRVGAPRLPTARAAGVPRRCADGHVVTRGRCWRPGVKTKPCQLSNPSHTSTVARHQTMPVHIALSHT